MFEKYQELEMNYLISKTDLENFMKMLEKNAVMSDDEKQKELELRKEQYNFAKTSFLEFYNINKQQIIKQFLEENIPFSIDIKTNNLEAKGVSFAYKNNEELDKMFNDVKSIIDSLSVKNKISSELYKDINIYLDDYKKDLQQKRDIAIKDNPNLLSSNSVRANICSTNEKVVEFKNIFFSLSSKIILIDLFIMLISYFVNGGSLTILINSIINLAFLVYLFIILLIIYTFEFPFILFLAYKLLFSKSLVNVLELNDLAVKIIDKSMFFFFFFFFFLAFIVVIAFSINMLFLSMFYSLIYQFNISVTYILARYILYPLSYIIPVVILFFIFNLIFGNILKKYVFKHLFFHYANKSKCKLNN